MSNFLFFETPESIAERLTKYIRPDASHVLDPCVGNGALLRPLFESRGERKYVCVDRNIDAISRLRSDLAFKQQELELICDDFLEWSKKTHMMFDVVLMNPPFSGRTENLTRINIDGHSNRHVPLEIAFALDAIKLLRENGLLLAVLPCSPVSGQKNTWFRQLLANTGRIETVHELPKRTFPGVESRIYLLVFRKTKVKQRTITLLNHDLNAPAIFKLPRLKFKENCRLDYGYQHTQAWIERLVRNTSFEWSKLGDLVTVHRGKICNSKRKSHHVHTDSFKNGFWVRSGSRKKGKANLPLVKRGDILVARVGRQCSGTFSKFTGLEGQNLTDCVFCVRPTNRSDALRILFAIKVLMNFPWSSYILERGTGATYISKRDLESLTIPLKLSDEYPAQFAKFERAVCRRNSNCCKTIIDDTCSVLLQDPVTV